METTSGMTGLILWIFRTKMFVCFVHPCCRWAASVQLFLVFGENSKALQVAKKMHTVDKPERVLCSQTTYPAGRSFWDEAGERQKEEKREGLTSVQIVITAGESGRFKLNYDWSSNEDTGGILWLIPVGSGLPDLQPHSLMPFAHMQEQRPGTAMWNTLPFCVAFPEPLCSRETVLKLCLLEVSGSSWRSDFCSLLQFHSCWSCGCSFK